MSIRKRKEREEGASRSYYAFADSVADPGLENPYRRLSVVFDAIDADYIDGLPDVAGFPKEAVIPGGGLGLLRIMTTHRRLGAMGTRIPKETDWLKIEINREPGTPRAWFAPDEANLVPGRVTNAPKIEQLDQDSALIQKLNTFCTAPEAKHVKAEKVFARMNLAGKEHLKITALDVGQASCTVFSNGSDDLGYYDVGWPISFNRHTVPAGFQRPYPTEGFVLLSHWDFDHYALAIKNPALMLLDWYAPDQKVGMYTARFQRRLGKRLHLISGNAASAGLFLERGLGTDPKDRNASGYIFRFERDGEAVLLTGDADYAHIPLHLKSDATTITVPHHGGTGSKPPKPARCRHPVAVASYGKNNTYKHPDEIHLADHINWRVRRTAAPRSDHDLFPIGQAIRKFTFAKKRFEKV